MSKFIVLLILILVAVLLAIWIRRKPLALPEEREGTRRIALARQHSTRAIAACFDSSELSYPPRELFLRAFKREAILEVWARCQPGPFRLVTTYQIMASSGLPGPKRREGDRQVPEGFYSISVFNPESAFHLSLKLNYPNASDLLHADPAAPGSNIFIHGGNSSIGCLPLGDSAIEELFLIAFDTFQSTRQAIPIHIFPARMDSSDWPAFAAAEIARDHSLAAFWDQLLPAYVFFQREHRLLEKQAQPSH